MNAAALRAAARVLCQDSGDDPCGPCTEEARRVLVAAATAVDAAECGQPGLFEVWSWPVVTHVALRDSNGGVVSDAVAVVQHPGAPEGAAYRIDSLAGSWSHDVAVRQAISLLCGGAA